MCLSLGVQEWLLGPVLVVLHLVLGLKLLAQRRIEQCKYVRVHQQLLVAFERMKMRTVLNRHFPLRKLTQSAIFSLFYFV